MANVLLSSQYLQFSKLGDVPIDAVIRQRNWRRSSCCTNSPKLLVCHDMKGNYLSDKWNCGSLYGDSFQILVWGLIDMFCYFSHNFITIPPKLWVEQCHRNDVPIIGTIITEWDAGYDICCCIFGCADSAIQFAQKITYLTKLHDLDGWLINIENKLEVHHIDNVLLFLKLLTSNLHAYKPHCEVIWYDSVTKDGKLRWQDTLNDSNKIFYDACDGIFVNYTWNEASVDQAAIALLNDATSRRSSVYFGIDVFGRNTYGGGKWNCNVAYEYLKLYPQAHHVKDQLVSDESSLSTRHLRGSRDPLAATNTQLVLPNSDCFSVALFAPGWIFEEFQLCQLLSLNFNKDSVDSSTRPGLKADVIVSEFEQMQSKIEQYNCLFWSQLVRSSRLHGNPSPPAVIKSLSSPVVISFAMAVGLNVFVSGTAHTHWSASLMLYLKTGNRQCLPCVPYYDMNQVLVSNWNVELVLCSELKEESVIPMSCNDVNIDPFASVSICYRASLNHNASLMICFNHCHPNNPSNGLIRTGNILAPGVHYRVVKDMDYSISLDLSVVKAEDVGIEAFSYRIGVEIVLELCAENTIHQKRHILWLEPAFLVKSTMGVYGEVRVESGEDAYIWKDIQWNTYLLTLPSYSDWMPDILLSNEPNNNRNIVLTGCHMIMECMDKDVQVSVLLDHLAIIPSSKDSTSRDNQMEMHTAAIHAALPVDSVVVNWDVSNTEICPPFDILGSDHQLLCVELSVLEEYDVTDRIEVLVYRSSDYLHRISAGSVPFKVQHVVMDTTQITYEYFAVDDSMSDGYIENTASKQQVLLLRKYLQHTASSCMIPLLLDARKEQDMVTSTVYLCLQHTTSSYEPAVSLG